MSYEELKAEPVSVPLWSVRKGDLKLVATWEEWLREFHQMLMFEAISIELVECDTCRAKLGMAQLCAGCVHNRLVISRLGGSMAYGPLGNELIEQFFFELGLKSRE